MELGKWGSGEDPAGIEGEETITRIQCMEKHFQSKIMSCEALD